MTEMQQLEIRPNVYYTSEEVAALLRVSPRCVTHLLEQGAARGIKIAGRWRVLGRDLLRLTTEGMATDPQWTRALARLSETAFARVWDNEEDSVYDYL